MSPSPPHLLLYLLLLLPLTHTLSTTILLTGGSGYIGSHTAVELLSRGYNVVVMDDLSNSKRESCRRALKLATAEVSTAAKCGSLEFRKANVRSEADVLKVLREFPSVNTVIHFAGLKAVGESSQIPLRYYDVNVSGSLNLLKCMDLCGVGNIVFSSSATVYGDPESLPVKEGSRTGRMSSVYGRNKFFVEEIIRDVVKGKDSNLNAFILRYFNPIGAHPSGTIGEDPKGLPNNLMPYISKVAIGSLPELSVFGDDYNTPDGTGVRDYIHVVDLAVGHVKAVEKLEAGFEGCEEINLGTGRGYSVLELVEGMRSASGRDIPYKIAPRRPGDVAEVYCDPEKAWEVLGWKAERGIKECCESTWKWQSNNPEGYVEEEIKQ